MSSIVVPWDKYDESMVAYIAFTGQAVDISFFKTSDYESFKDDLNPERTPNTCEWFLQHAQYRQWHDSDHDDLLWLSADPGCGKSVLSKVLVDEGLATGKCGLTLHFFFKDNADQSSAATAMCALLHQLFRV